MGRGGDEPAARGSAHRRILGLCRRAARRHDDGAIRRRGDPHRPDRRRRSTIHRWPVTESGASLYWAGLNKAKRSVALALDKPEGRELAQAIATAPGAGAGIVLTNLPPLPGLDYASLKAARDDVILLRLIGNRDGSAAVDYTVNAASGFPLVTGHSDGTGGAPVNHVLPAWDVAAGLYLSTALLAAERHRSRTGAGQEIIAALADVMLAMVGHLGYIGDVQINGRSRPPLGNDLYGSFGRDFATADGRRVMIIALTPRQWRALGRATGLADELATLGAMTGRRSRHREPAASQARDAIAALIAPWCAARTLAEIARGLRRQRRAVGPVSGFCRAGRATTRAARRRTRSSPRSTSPGSGRYLAARPAARFRRRAARADPPGAAPRRAYR